ncbi:MAG: bifunctional oligoribonuclease/PAP phosphatase NrnA [Lachnospiraceae bacterium]
MIDLKKELEGVRSAAILGHIRPDGDCIGSCLSLYNYIRTYYPQIRVQVYLQPFAEEYLILKNADKISHDSGDDRCYDLCFSLDSADAARHGEFLRYLETAARTVGIDHHVTNAGFTDEKLIVSSASATAEILAELIGKDALTKEIAECLFLAIAHDTGVFQYSNTSPKTMRIVADLLETGIDGNRIIDTTFYQKSHAQNQILGKTLMESEMLLDGKCVVGCVTLADMEAYGVTAKDLDGIVSQLRYTRGVEAAIFLYELEEGKFKVSMRANGAVDVSRIAAHFGGGGHVKAAGAEMEGTFREIVESLTGHIEKQLRENEREKRNY